MSELEQIKQRQEAMEARQDKQEAIHTETMIKIGELVTELKVSNANNAHRDKEVDSLKIEVKEIRSTQVEILKQQSENKPMIDLVKGLNTRIWALIAAAVAGSLGIVGMIGTYISKGG